MARLLILFAHPALEKSRVQRRLIREVPDLADITFHDLYEAYPQFAIDVQHEQELLRNHDILILQHPFYWYSTPPIMKQWIDLVLEHGWAYGSQGHALQGKYWLNLISAGGSTMTYRHEGYNRATVRELLLPLEHTARLCHMTFLPPYVVFGTHRLDTPDIEQAAAHYRQLLFLLQAEQLDLAAATEAPTLNVILERALQREVPT
ncbi:MAG TPA: NAD(P)H-dependent oxidoreductase [Roseiflexaceae bacterium]|nr:NAD(P)H-dependent oxidoreductase [Roseiflexaceae bacterium]HMP41214.1 NAD(P)H-dependent oxidoreductase [Roseiflexaceae bacterium]